MSEQLTGSHESRLLQAAMDGSAVAYAYFDPSDRLQHWNRAYEDLNFRVRGLIRKGVPFSDLLAELVVKRQIVIEDLSTSDWIEKRLQERRSGGLAFRRLSNGRVYLVQERKDEIGGTLGFWINVTRLVDGGLLGAALGEHSVPPGDVRDHGVQDRIRDQLQILQSNLELLSQDARDIPTASRVDQALQATRSITSILDTRRLHAP